MNKKQIQKQIVELFNTGNSKSEVYKILSDKGENTSLVAYLIASNPNTDIYKQHYKKITVLIVIMFVIALLGAPSGYSVGLKIGSTAAWITLLLSALVPLLFAYGFYKNYARAYNTYILLTFALLPSGFIGITKEPIAASIGIAINLAVLGYVWYLRSRLFPDFNFIGPKKIKDQYVFTS